MACGLATVAGGCGPGWVAAAGGDGPGYDVYRPEPYLLVVGTDGVGSTTRPAAQRYTASIVYLPDYAQRYRVRSVAGGTSISIRDGWMLTSLSDHNAASDLLNSALASAGPSAPGGGALGLLPLAASTAAGGAPAPGTPSAPAADRAGPSLFKIIYGPSGMVTGLTRVPMVEGETRSTRLSDHAPPPVPVYAEPK